MSIISTHTLFYELWYWNIYSLSSTLSEHVNNVKLVVKPDQLAADVIQYIWHNIYSSVLPETNSYGTDRK